MRADADRVPGRAGVLVAALMLSVALVAPVAVGLGTGPVAGASPARCGYYQLMAFASTGGGAFDGAGTHAYDVLLANVGHTTCELEGFPDVTFSDSVGTLTRVHVERNRSETFQSEPPRRVTLEPGAIASFGISYGDGYAPASDIPSACVATSARFLLPVAEQYKLAYDVAVTLDLCRAGWRIGVTPIEGGPVPRRPSNT